METHAVVYRLSSIVNVVGAQAGSHEERRRTHGGNCRSCICTAKYTGLQTLPTHCYRAFYNYTRTRHGALLLPRVESLLEVRVGQGHCAHNHGFSRRERGGSM
jgi:hypothetical protein